MRWQTPVVWEHRLNQCDAIFETSKRLPEVVHRLKLAPLPIFDGDVIFGSNAWPMLAALAALHGDQEVNFLTVEPTSESFLASTGSYGGFTIPPCSTSDAFGAALFDSTLIGSPGAIGHAAEVAAVFGDSLAWGIWSERNIAGVVTAADPGLLGEWQLEHGPFVSIEDALQEFLGVNLGSKAGAELFATFEQNFSLFD